jgi:hypothetical protein
MGRTIFACGVRADGIFRASADSTCIRIVAEETIEMPSLYIRLFSPPLVKRTPPHLVCKSL